MAIFLGCAEPGSSASGGSTSSVDTDSASGESSTGSTGGTADTETDGTTDETGTGAGDGLFERGVIVEPRTMQCTPVETGRPQTDCNHHGSSVIELPDGRIAVAWYFGEYEKSLDTGIVWATHDGEAWSEPDVLFDDPERSEGNPALWVTDGGELLVFFVSIWGEGWDDTRIRLVRSGDLGETWSDPVILRDESCWNTRHKPVVKADGGVILPLYLECLAVPVYMHSSDDFVDDVQWTEFEDLPDPQAYFADHVGQIQPSLIVLDDGGLAAMTRNGLGDGRIRRTVGDASGQQWTPSVGIDLPNSGTSIDQVRLDNGHVVVIFNNSPEERFPLSAALSLDEGETFVAIRDLDDSCEEDECTYPYPSVTQARDGTIWVSYTHNHETIGWVHFDETWLEHGDDPAVLP